MILYFILRINLHKLLSLPCVRALENTTHHTPHRSRPLHILYSPLPQHIDTEAPIYSETTARATADSKLKD